MLKMILELNKMDIDAAARPREAGRFAPRLDLADRSSNGVGSAERILSQSLLIEVPLSDCQAMFLIARDVRRPPRNNRVRAYFRVITQYEIFGFAGGDRACPKAEIGNAS